VSRPKPQVYITINLYRRLRVACEQQIQIGEHSVPCSPIDATSGSAHARHACPAR